MQGPPSTASFPGAASSARGGIAANPFLYSAEQRMAWARHRFFEAGERPPADWVDEAVLQSWRHCLGRGRRPDDLPVFEAISAVRTRTLLDRHHALLAAADPEIEQLARQVAGTGCMTLLTDRRGVAMRAIHPHAPSALLQQSGRVGVDLGESAFGGTAPGIAAEASVACTVSGAEHFFTALQQVHCVAAPIHNLRGEVAGVLDLTIDGQPFGFDAAGLVRLSALAIERRLITGQLAARGHWQLHFHTRSEWLETALTGSVAFDEDGRIVWCNAAARALCPALEAAPGTSGAVTRVDLLLSIGRGALQSASPTGSDPARSPGFARLPSGLGVWWRIQAPARLGLQRGASVPGSAFAEDDPPSGAAASQPALQGLSDAGALPGTRLGQADGAPATGNAASPPPSAPAGSTTLDAANRGWIVSVLERHRGNVSLAARELGVSRGLLYRRIRQWGLERPGSAAPGARSG